MTTPKVTITELTRNLGTLPPTTNIPMAIIAPADNGPLNTPGAYSRTEDVEADFEGGHLVKCAAYALANFGGPVVVCRCDTTTDGSTGAPVIAADGTVSAVTKTGTGSSVFTIQAGATPNAAYSVKVRFPTGGTRGVSGIIYQVSLDGGATYGIERSLGTAVNFTIPNGGGIQVNVGAGTIVDNDFITFTTTAPALASSGSLVVTFTGTSVPTIDASSDPNGYYQGYVIFKTGGTIGVTGITYQESLDGGRTLSPVKSLGTALFFTIADSGSIRVNLAAGTIVAGDKLTFVATPPLPSASNLGDSMDALSRTSLPWQFVQVGGEIGSAGLSMLDTKLSGMKAIGKFRWAIAHTRMPNPGESNSAYRTSIVGVFGSLRTTSLVALSAAACKTTADDGRRYRWPNTVAVAALVASVSAQINVAAKDVGTLKGVRIVDDNGNPDEYDERLDGGLDDAGFLVLRTWDDEGGAFVNIPRVFSAPGDDVRLIPHRRVLNLFDQTLRKYFESRLSKDTLVSKTTGFILEQEAQDMEKAAVKRCRGVLGAAPMVSDITVVVSRTDDLLHEDDPVIHVTGSIVPLVYPQGFAITTSFAAPASSVVAA